MTVSLSLELCRSGSEISIGQSENCTNQELLQEFSIPVTIRKEMHQSLVLPRSCLSTIHLTILPDITDLSQGCGPYAYVRKLKRNNSPLLDSVRGQTTLSPSNSLYLGSNGVGWVSLHNDCQLQFFPQAIKHSRQHDGTLQQNCYRVTDFFQPGGPIFTYSWWNSAPASQK